MIEVPVSPNGDDPRFTTDRIGKYLLERRIGAGGFASVWLGYDEDLDARVAIKVLADNWAFDLDVRRRFIEEARFLWRADHDRIVRVHGVGELPDGRPYFVMDWADGGTLHDRLRARLTETGRAFTLDETVGYAGEIAESLEVVHALGLIHRDLKPSNILFRSRPSRRSRLAASEGDASGREEHMVLADFGLAKELAAASGFTAAVGTPERMAPEQGRAGANIDARVDVYALATIVFELLTGRLPPADRDQPPRLRDLRPDVPPAVQELIERNLAVDPDRRHASASEFAEALRAAAAPPSPVGVAAEQTHRPPQPPPRPRISRSAALVSVGLVAVAVAAVLVVRASGGGPSPSTTTPPTTTPPTTLQPEVIFTDDFASARWLQSETDQRVYSYADSEYRIVAREPRRQWSTTAPVAALAGNVRVEVDATKAGGTGGTFGITCRYTTASTRVGSYTGSIDTNGFWRITKYSPTEDSAKTLTAAQNSSQYNRAIKQSGPNHLTLECEGGDQPGGEVTVRLFVNGQLAAMARDAPGLPFGGVGVAVSAGDEPVEVHFDNYRVTRY